jgi:3-hydroxyacyl-CoA dehydrogenase
METKRAVFAHLASACRPDAILATNTSTLDVDEIAAAATNAERALGMHFFSPAHVMRLLEVVRGEATSRETVASVLAFARRIGKVPVVVGNCDGFVGNRMLLRYRREAEMALERGATPAEVDRALQGFGFAMGPFAVADLAGVDVGWRAKMERNKRGGLPFRVSDIPDRLVEAGRLGQKTGAGYYRYEPGSRTPRPDPAVLEILARERERVGVVPRPIGNEEIVARCITALINEGARVLDDGTASSPADIDTIWRTGYGFPAERGGPMAYADATGLGRVLAAVRRYAEDDGAFWEPAPLLVRLAEKGERFSSLDQGHHRLEDSETR